MLINIGDTKQASDIVDLLLECHERILAFAALACRLATTEGLSDNEIRDAAGRIVRYFSQSLPLHVADEEESIVPRLSNRNADLDQALRTMHEEHTEHAGDVESLVHTCRRLETAPEQLPNLRAELLRSASGLQEKFVAHLRREEQVILP